MYVMTIIIWLLKVFFFTAIIVLVVGWFGIQDSLKDKD